MIGAALLIALVLANDSPPLPAPPSMIQDVTTDPGRTIERNGVSWNELAIQVGETFRCGYRNQKCREKQIVVRNDTDETLRCRGAFRYAQPNADFIEDAVRVRIIPPGKSEPVVRSESPIDMQPVSFESDCTPEPRLSPLEKPVECRLTIVKGVDLNHFYPKASKRALHEGAVYIEFELSESPGQPRNGVVVQTSTYPKLDAAALLSNNASTMSTNCLGQRFRTAVTFRLD